MAAKGDHQHKRAKYDTKRIFDEVNAVFMWDGYLSETERCRVKIFNNRFHQEGGWRGTDVSPQTTHIISNKWSAILKHHWDCKKCPFRISSTVECVSYEWVKTCLTVSKLVPERFFRIDLGNEDPAIQYASFKEACGVIGADGQWKYVGWKGWDVAKEEVEEQEAPKIAEALDNAKKKKPIFDLPPWLQEAPKRKLPAVIEAPAWLDNPDL